MQCVPLKDNAGLGPTLPKYTMIRSVRNITNNVENSNFINQILEENKDNTIQHRQWTNVMELKIRCLDELFPRELPTVATPRLFNADPLNADPPVPQTSSCVFVQIDDRFD